MKRIAALLIAFAILISVCAVPSFAASGGKLVASKVSGAPGDTVTVSISLQDNPGMVTLSMTMSYDTAVLQLTKVTSTGLLNGETLNKKYKSPYTITFVDYDLEEDVTANGPIVNCTFQILDTAAAGKSAITLKFKDSYKTDYTPNTLTVENGEVEVVPAADPVAAVVAAGGEVERYTTVKAAADACASGSYVKLLADTEENFTCAKDLYLDLNGKTLSGSIAMGSYTLYGADSATDGYTAEGIGKLTASVTGNVSATHRMAHPYLASGQVRRYLAVQAADGSYTFNRFYIGVRAIALHTFSGEVGYSMVTAGNENVKNALKTTDSFGIRVWAGEGVTSAQASSAGTLKEFSLDCADFTAGAEGNKKIVLIENQLETIKESPAAYENIPVHAEVFVRFNGTEEVASATYSYSIKNMFRLMDNAFNSWAVSEKDSVKALYGKYPYMTDWGLTNIAAYSAK